MSKPSPIVNMMLCNRCVFAARKEFPGKQVIESSSGVSSRGVKPCGHCQKKRYVSAYTIADRVENEGVG